MQSIDNTPSYEGYYMPPEWCEHEATWISWPNNHDTWVTQIRDVEQTFVEMIKFISEGERVKLLLDNEQEKKRVLDTLKQANLNLQAIEFIICPTVDVWIRDYGPNFLINQSGAKAFNRWRFNAWGDKYEDLKRDDSVLDILESKLPFKFESGLVLEGGSIEVNGVGDCLTTKQCLLNPNRNPTLSQSDLEKKLKDCLGVSRIHWLDQGIEGDDTDGHIDDIARFIDEKTIVVMQQEDVNHPNHAKLKKNIEKLKSFRGVNNSSFNIRFLPSPKDVAFQGETLPASYANFYICNSAVLVPIFGDQNDKIALGILDDLFATKKVVGIDCRVMVRGLGTIHCATQQEPMGRKA